MLKEMHDGLHCKTRTFSFFSLQRENGVDLELDYKWHTGCFTRAGTTETTVFLLRNFTNFSVSLLLLHQYLSHTGYHFVRSVVFPVKRVNPDFHSQGWTSTDHWQGF